MNENPPLSAQQFSRRLAELCLRTTLTGIPKKDLDQQILLKSALLVLGGDGPWNEKDLTARLDSWTREVCDIQGFDRVSLRRWLVDSGYLRRSRDGSTYQVAQPGPRPELFSPEVEQLDVPGLLAEARAEIARRKQEFSDKTRKG